MADISRDSYTQSKGYEKVIWQQGKPLLDFDLNEAQDTLRGFRDLSTAQLAESLNLLGSAGAITPNAAARCVNVGAGIASHLGVMVRIPASTALQVFASGISTGTSTSIVYGEWWDAEVTSATDSAFLDATFGASTVRTQRNVQVNTVAGTTLPVVVGHNIFLIGTITHNFTANGTGILQADITQAAYGLTPGELSGTGSVRTLAFKTKAAAASDGVIFDSVNTLTGAHTRWRNAGSDLLILLSSGFLGLGISPTQRLHVSGNILATGTLTATAIAGTTGGFTGAVTTVGVNVNPASAGAPFTLGTNALTQLVVGLNADYVSGQHGDFYRTWGNLLSVPTTFTPSAHTQAFSTITATPTTLAGYGIVDAAALVHTHAASDIVSGTLGVTRGGTGISNPTVGSVLVGNGASALSQIAAGTAGQFLRSTGSTWASAAIGASDLPGMALLTHTVSGLTTGNALKALSATTFGFGQVMWAELGSVPTTFAPTAHDIAGASHTAVVSGAGQVLQSTGVNAFHWAALDWTAVINKPTTFTPTAHDIITTHTASGLTTGAFLRATGTTTFGFTALIAADLPSHNQPFSTITATPTTRAGYGITDAAASVHTHGAGDLTGGAFGGAANYSFPKNLSVVGQLYSTETDLGDVSGAVLIDWNLGNQARIRLVGNIVLGFVNANLGAIYTLTIEQDATGGRTVTWPGTVRWPNALAPTLTVTGSQQDVLTFLKRGSLFLGIESGFNYANV